MNWNDLIAEVPRLAYGSHAELGNELCFMEMTAFLAGEPHSDHPECACPVLTAYGIRLNDSGQEYRDLLTPLVPMMIGTRNDDLEAERRKHLVFGVAKRIVAPMLAKHIDQIYVQSILGAEDYESLRLACEEAQAKARAAYAANAAANAVAYAAATNAADAAAYAAAYADDDAYRNTAVDILREAIELDPNLKPIQLDMGRVERLKELC